MRSAALTALLLAFANAANAQQDNPLAHASLPRSVEYRITAVIENPNTRQITGAATISDTVHTDVVAQKGSLTVRGRIDGQLIIIDGDAIFEPGAIVTGDVTIVGGDAKGIENADIGGTITMYGEAILPFGRDDRVYTVNRHSRRVYRDDDRRDWGYSTISFRTGWNYNRVEGLPIEFGPSVETGGDNPTRFEAHAIWRTEVASPFETDDWGYSVRVEQFLFGKHDFRLGASLSNTVQPIESWQLNKHEASLGTFLFHEDNRDYFKREGWGVYARYTPRATGLSALLSYNDDDHFTEPARDPWTLFNGDDVWRLQPIVLEDRFQTLTGTVLLDRRNDDDYATDGFLVRADLTQALNHDFTHGLIDARIYRRVNRYGTLSFRGVAAGALSSDAMPTQFQHALGGAGSMPGYELFAADCGARRFPVARNGHAFYTSYGCDQMAMFSAEYRGGWDIHWGGWDWSDDDGREEHDWNFDAHPKWVVFFDAGKGWARKESKARGAFDTEALYDIGAGLTLGDFGIYGAVPLTGDDRGMKFFIRLGPRF